MESAGQQHGDRIMRWAIILSATLGILTASNAHANEWCGYASRANATIECGYSTVADCETAVGKGGMCFVDPDYALNVKRAAPATAAKPSAGQS
jgi:hypothetical protein